MISLVDVQPIGPSASTVGFATLNGFVRDRIGVHMSFYVITDWLGLIPLVVAAGFGILGLCQWIRRGKLQYVDKDILLLGGFYIIVMGFYLLFEGITVNYRPVLINGTLEKSYPSSTTMLVLCVISTSILQLRIRIKHPVLLRLTTYLLVAFTVFMVVGRVISGVHWITDIIGGIFLSAGLVMTYHCLCTAKA